MNRTFQIFLLDKLKNSWQEADDGSIITGPTLPLKSEPIGWRDLQIDVDIDNTYFGIKKAISVALQYVYDGAAIMRYLLYKRGGFNEEVYLLITKRNRTSEIYEKEYYGRLDMATAIDNPKIGVTVNAKEGGLQADLDGLGDTVVELALDNTNPALIRTLFDGVDLFDTLHYTIFQSQTSNAQCYFTVPLVYVNNEGDSVGIIHGDQTYEEIADDAAKDAYLASSSNDFFEPAIVVNGAVLAGSISVTQYGVPQFDLALRSSKGKYLLIADNQSIGNGNTQVYNFSFTVNAEPGERFFIMGAKDSVDPNQQNILQFNETEFTVKYTSRNTPSTAGTLTISEALRQIAKSWNPLYDLVWRADADDIVCYSGMSLRQQKKPVLKESFKSLFQKCTYLPLCVNIIGNTMYIDNRVNRYTSNTSTVIFDLNSVPDLLISPIQENIFNKLTVGWTNQTTEERNGLYVFNSENQFQFPSPNSKELNLISQAISDPYVIEFNRGKLNNKDTTDDSADNSCYFTQIVKKTQIPGKYTIQWAATGRVLTIIDGAALVLPNLFELVSDDDDFNYFIFTVVSQSVIGNDLSVIVNETPPSTLALLSNTIISLPAKLFRQVYDVLEGVPTPNIDGPGALFNINLSPAHVLRNWGPHFASIFYQQRNLKAKFSTGLRNTNLAVTLNGVRIAENADIYISDLGQPYFLNYSGQFTANVPMSFSKQISLLNQSAEVRIRYRGFLLYMLAYGKMSAKPAMNEPQKWELWFSAKNSLDTLYLLQDENIETVSDMADNTVSWSKLLSPLMMVYVDYNKGSRYKYYNSDEDMICNRNKQFGTQPFWAQPWETKADYISQQFLTRGVAQMDMFVYDLKGTQITSYQSRIIPNASLRNGLVLQQFDIQCSDFEEGYYQFAFKANGITLLLTEIQHFLYEHDDTMALEYYHRLNKNAAYFKSDSEQWRPMIRINAAFGQTLSQGTSTDYDSEDEYNVIDAEVYSTVDIRYDSIPDQEQRRNDAILRLDHVEIDGERVTLPNGNKLEAEKLPGVPFVSCTATLRYVENNDVISVTDAGIAEGMPSIFASLNASMFGQGEGIIDVEIKPG